MATATSGYKLFDDFVTEILQYAPAAPTIMVRTHVRNTLIDFLERSMILEKDPSSFFLDEGEHTYTLKYNNDRYRAVTIRGLVRLGEENSSSQAICVTSEHELDSWLRKWRAHESNTPTQCFLTPDINKVRFYPTPDTDSDKEVFMTTAVTLKRDQTEVDEFIYEKWESVIQAGALGTLLKIRGATWYDRGMAENFSDEYTRGVKQARSVALRGTGEFAGRVEPQSFTVFGSTGLNGSGSTVWD